MENRAAAWLERLGTCVAGCEGGSLFKVSICTGSFWIDQHLIASLENHDGVREIYLIAKAYVLYIHHALGFHAFTLHWSSP